jgi:hypothetical protein
MHGLIFHEMSHLVNHHTSAEVKERTRKVYVAPPSAPEPIGADAEKHNGGQAILDEWFGHASIAGAYSSTSLADLPMGGYGDWLLEQFIAYIPYLPYPGSSCATQAQTVANIARSGTYSDFDQSFTVSTSGTSTRLSVINTLKTCIGTTAYTFGSFRGYLEPYAPEVFATYTTADASKFDGLKAFDGLIALIGDRRAKMRGLQTKFQDVTGQPWSAARYFSTEEEADDESARITGQTGISETGVTGIMLAAMGSDAARCKQALSSGERIPYGENLEDDHHGSCWRIMHAEQFENHVMNRSRRRPTEAKTAWVPTKVSTKPVY